MNFETTRAVFERFDEWIARLAAPYLPLRRAFDASGEFHWEFSEQSGRTLLVGKAVRMVSGIRAAMLLADHGFSTESASLCRMASDFSQEIIAIGEGLLEGRMTTSQQEFIDQYFAPLARDPEELEKRGREFYVAREKLMAAAQRLVDKTTKKWGEMRKATRFLNYGFDKYVHGAYLTATELYRGDEHRFMLRGTEFEELVCVARRTVAAKTHEVLHALELMALIARDEALCREIRAADRALDASGEQSVRCR